MQNLSLPEFRIQSIGVVKSEIKQRYEAPRQGVLSDDDSSVIKLHPGNNFQQALTGLEGFDRIWVIFLFHLNPNWNPMVSPPRHTRKKMGVFATRSPHRPSQIGISCVKLISIKGLKVYITESDILDGSPVLDIKPYLPFSDSFPEVKTGWVNTRASETHYTINFNNEVKDCMAWLNKKAGINLRSFIKLQLEFNPENYSRKRISPVENKAGDFILAYRTWRIQYTVDNEHEAIVINRIFSGYTIEQIKNHADDPHNDKQLHAEFLDCFSR